MDNRPIGIFDSGLGGLTTVRELRRIMPSESIIYFGDTGRVPYGTRSRETIRKYAEQDIRFLLSKDVKMIVAACNTAAAALAGRLDAIGIPTAEAVSPAVHAACRTTRNGRIAVIGTSAAIRSGAYERALHQVDSSLEIISAACPLFVPLVENGFGFSGTTDKEEIARLTAEHYLAPLREREIDTLILGCTHYPILKDVIRRVMGDKVALIDSGQEAARAAMAVLEQKNMQNATRRIGCCEYFVSDSPADFAENAHVILGGALTDESAVQIDIEMF